MFKRPSCYHVDASIAEIRRPRSVLGMDQTQLMAYLYRLTVNQSYRPTVKWHTKRQIVWLPLETELCYDDRQLSRFVFKPGCQFSVFQLRFQLISWISTTRTSLLQTLMDTPIIQHFTSANGGDQAIWRLGLCRVTADRYYRSAVKLHRTNVSLADPCQKKCKILAASISSWNVGCTVSSRNQTNWSLACVVWQLIGMIDLLSYHLTVKRQMLVPDRLIPTRKWA